MSRRQIARKLKVSLTTLRHWEAAGLMPLHSSVPVEIYRDRVRLICAGRRVMSMQRIRRSLSTGGF
jgi:DNA-binding transcriptional MerR regulator